MTIHAAFFRRLAEQCGHEVADEVQHFANRVVTTGSGFAKLIAKSSDSLHLILDLDDLPVTPNDEYRNWRNSQTILIFRGSGHVHRQGGLKKYLADRGIDVEPWNELNYRLGQVDPRLGVRGTTALGAESFYEEGNSIEVAKFAALIPEVEHAISEYVIAVAGEIDNPRITRRAQENTQSRPSSNVERNEVVRVDELTRIAQEELTDDSYWEKTAENPNLVWREIEQRRGQRTFRQDLMIAYDRRCAITGCDLEEALEAAHIEKYSDTRLNDLRNGLLLRADIHTLFDCFLITVHPDNYRIECADKILETKDYRALTGREIRRPEKPHAWPSKEFLTRHYERFLEPEA